MREMREVNNKIVRSLLNSLLPVLAAFILGAFIIMYIGEDPMETYGILITKSLFTKKGILNTLHFAAPLILTGLATAVTFKANIYNMGVEGQLLLGGFFAGIVGASLPEMNPLLAKAICLATGIGCGMLFALLPALLKAKFDVNEMVVTLMLNYAMLKFLEFLTTGVFRDQAAGYVATPTIERQAMFTCIGNSHLTAFFFIVLILFIAMYVLMNKSTLGFELTSVGKNPEFAEACGMNVSRKIIVLMLISGALAGAAGAGWMMGEEYKFTLGFSANPGLGWDGMLIALLGGHSPLGILISSIFYAALKTGSDSINLYTSVPKEIVFIIQGIIILFLSVKFISAKKQLGKKKEA